VLACLVLAVGGAAGLVYAKIQSGTPSCSWALQARGVATSSQEGLVRCYLQALATRNRSLMGKIATNPPRSKITRADFRYSRAARAGTATATFSPSPVDSTVVNVTVHFADGVVDRELGLYNEIAFGGPSVWRVSVGSAWDS